MKHIISKDNALIESNYTLDVVQQRLVMLAIIEARKQKNLIEAGGLLRINADSYIQHFGVERHTAYEALKRACQGLFEQYFVYSKIDEASGKIGNYKSRWVDKIGYIDGMACVELVFASDVIPLITRLEKRYTEYELRQVSQLQSSYAIRLYELLIQWRSVGKTPEITLQEFRHKLGVMDKEYQSMWNFKARVLDLAVLQVNEHTDIIVKYEQHKIGRTISGFSFSFKQKTKEIKKGLPILGKKESLPPPKINLTWSLAETSMFKMLKSKCPTLSKENIEEFAVAVQTGLNDVLHDMYLRYAKETQFIFDINEQCAAYTIARQARAVSADE